MRTKKVHLGCLMGTEKCNSGWTEALTSQGVCQILNVTNNQAERNLNINLLFALNYTGRSFNVISGRIRYIFR